MDTGQDPYLLGNFHGGFALIRGLFRSHGLMYNGLLACAGYDHVAIAISECRYGYYKLGLDFFEACNRALSAEAIVLHRRLFPADGSNQTEIEKAVAQLEERSETFRLHSRACFREPEVLLNLHEGSRFRGEEALLLVGHAEKTAVGVFCVGGNINYELGMTQSIVAKRLASDRHQGAVAANATLPNRDTGW